MEPKSVYPHSQRQFHKNCEYESSIYKKVILQLV